MKGIAVESILVIGGLLILLTLGFSFFSGGNAASSLFGWQGTILAGVENFFLSVYNIMVVISGWVTIGILGVIFIGVQVVFVYFYYKLFQIISVFQPTVRRILDELTGF